MYLSAKVRREPQTLDFIGTNTKNMKRKASKPIILPHLVSSFRFGDDTNAQDTDELPWNDPTDGSSAIVTPHPETTSDLLSSPKHESLDVEQVSGEVASLGLPKQSRRYAASGVDADTSTDGAQPRVFTALPPRRSVKCAKYPSHMVSSVFATDNGSHPIRTGKKCTFVLNETNSRQEDRGIGIEGSTGSGVEMMKSPKQIESEEQPYRLIRKPCIHRADSMHGVFHYASTESLTSLSPLSVGQQRSAMHDVMHHDSLPLTSPRTPRRQQLSFENTKLNVFGGSSVPEEYVVNPSASPRRGASCASGDALSSSVWDTESFTSLFGAAITPPPPKPRREDTHSNVFGVSATVGRNAMSEQCFGQTQCQSARSNLLDWCGTAADNVVKSRRPATTIRLLPSTPGQYRFLVLSMQRSHFGKYQHGLLLFYIDLCIVKIPRAK